MWDSAVIAIGGDMIIRCAPEERHLFPAGLVWKDSRGKKGDCIEASCDASQLEEHGLVLHWTHDGWRIGKIHTEHGWKHVGVGKEGPHYAIILKKVINSKKGFSGWLDMAKNNGWIKTDE